ncbi:RDD family protein [Paenibacillus senegalensis]|uniref:RDD family protein n=1 Tax=Paenibacillus senegalensis TaxID=1465766 RepID=UPI00028A2911|nr:RDD family protein [Paenibacillus senegalensis]
MQDTYRRQSTVVTSEHVRLQLTMAGLGSRAAALLLDMLIIIGIIMAVNLILYLLLALIGTDLANLMGQYVDAFLIVFSWLLFSAYYIVMEYYYGGQTLGKKWLGIRVIQENGQPLTFLSAAIRTFFRLIDFLPIMFILGAVWIFFHPQDRRLGDVAAGTVVVRDAQQESLRREKRLNKWLKKFQAKYVVHLTLSPSLSEQMSREDWQLLQGLVERMPALDARKQYELASKLAHLLGARLNLPREQYSSYPQAFLVELYMTVREEWKLGA